MKFEVVHVGFLAVAGFTVFTAGCGRAKAPPASAIRATDASLASLETQVTPPEDAFASWRNLDQDGREPDRDVPTSWSADEGVVWKADIPGSGHSSPIVWDDHVFLTTADPSQQTQSVLAIDKASGNQLWKTVVHSGDLPGMHKKNSHASSTPACDGVHVYAAFIHGESLFVTACDFQGNRVWQREVGPFESEHGYGSSVVLWKGLLFVCGDSPGNGYLAALVRDSGEIMWRTPREGAGIHGNYATPLVAELAGRPQLVHSGYGRVVSYDPTSGEELWRCDGPAEVMANTIVARDPHVIVSGGYPEKEILCIAADGEGDVTDSHIVWRADRGVTYVPSPTILDDVLYSLSDDGILAAFQMRDGKRLWQKRLGGNFSASPLVIGDTFYVPDESGEVLVFRVQPGYELIAKNRLDDSGGMASIAVSGAQLFIRTSGKLYCVR